MNALNSPTVRATTYDHAPAMNDIKGAALKVRQAILGRFPPGPERDAGLAWLAANATEYVAVDPQTLLAVGNT